MRMSQLATDNISIDIRPLIVTNSAPLSTTAHFHTSLKIVYASDESHISSVAGLPCDVTGVTETETFKAFMQPLPCACSYYPFVDSPIAELLTNSIVTTACRICSFIVSTFTMFDFNAKISLHPSCGMHDF